MAALSSPQQRTALAMPAAARAAKRLHASAAAEPMAKTGAESPDTVRRSARRAVQPRDDSGFEKRFELERTAAQPVAPKPRGRGAQSNASGRFEIYARVPESDGWTEIEEELKPLATQITLERAKTIITRNDSPDISFDRSINPYRGCEHGCV